MSEDTEAIRNDFKNMLACNSEARDRAIKAFMALGLSEREAKALVNEPNMRQVYIFDETIVDRGTMFSKTPRPFKVHYHKASGNCTELCQVIERDEE